ncbi:MAG TPA: methyltransferase type 11, partial [Verrucomicrobiae bacterium]|nr:methyltransferase type 11 [Verrucomicrobiae bacterium]
AFAREIRRVGKKVWVQTPAREFFFEPHFMGFFVHWFSPAIRRKLVRYFTLWGWLEKPDQARIESVVQEIRLLSFGEVRELFPDCEIYRERFLGIFTKSYIAFRA